MTAYESYYLQIPYNLISCNAQENSMGSVLLLFWFHRGENWALERISNTVGEWLSEVSNPSLIESGASLKHTISDWIHLQLSPQSVALVSLCPKAYAQSPLNITCAYTSQEGINQCSLISLSINIWYRPSWLVGAFSRSVIILSAVSKLEEMNKLSQSNIILINFDVVITNLLITMGTWMQSLVGGWPGLEEQNLFR